MAVMKPEKVEKGRHDVSSVVACDGTPALNIQPCLPSFDCPTGNRVLYLENKLDIKK